MHRTTPLISSIQEAVSERSLLQHAFYQAWSKGELTTEHLAGYAKEYYWLAKHVPSIMDAVMKAMPEDMDPVIKDALKHNAQDEIDHIELWERFALSLGISKEELLAYQPTDTVKHAVSALLKIASRSFEEGVAAMYAFECELPEISRSKCEGLLKFYGMKSPDAHAYFEEHIAEEKHLCVWRKILSGFDADRRDSALQAASETVTSQNHVLDGVVERYCPELCACA